MKCSAEQKRKIREVMTDKRDHLGSEWKKNYDNNIVEELIGLVEKYNYQIIHTYIPYRSEIDIKAFIQYLLDSNRTVVVPQTLKNGALKHHILTSLDSLKQGEYGTSYSSSNQEYTGSYDLVIVPGLAFDPKHYRLGYGGGYYDRFLTTIPNSFTLGLAYPFQVINELPTDDFDVHLDEVLLVSEYQG